MSGDAENNSNPLSFITNIFSMFGGNKDETGKSNNNDGGGLLGGLKDFFVADGWIGKIVQALTFGLFTWGAGKLGLKGALKKSFVGAAAATASNQLMKHFFGKDNEADLSKGQIKEIANKSRLDVKQAKFIAKECQKAFEGKNADDLKQGSDFMQSFTNKVIGKMEGKGLAGDLTSKFQIQAAIQEFKQNHFSLSM